MQIGLLSLGDCLDDPATGLRPTPAERHRAIVDEAVLAESLGFDSVWLGAHPSCASVLASPSVLLAAIAARTSRVRIGAGVALLANLDPVRVAEDYATVDAISDGRVELVAFGPVAGESCERDREHLALLLRLWRETEVTWSGRFRAPLDAVTVEPRPVQKPHPPVWVGGDVSLPSVDLAAELGLPLLLPSVLMPALDFAPLVTRYRERFAAAGHDSAAARVGCCQHVRVRPDSQDARLDLDSEQLRAGVTVCGSPAEVVDRIGAARDALGLDVHLAILDQGGLELYSAAVAPQLRQPGAGPEM